MQGSALVLLYPSEETYVDFLAINKEPLSLTVMQGSALVLLYPSEETYVDFLAINQKVRLNQMALEVEDKVGFSTQHLLI